MKTWTIIFSILISSYSYGIKFYLYPNGEGDKFELDDKEFKDFFKSKQNFTLQGIFIQDNGHELLNFLTPYGNVRIEKKSENEYYIFFIAPIHFADTFAFRDIIKYQLTFKEDKYFLSQEKNYTGQPKISTKEIEQAVYERHKMITDSLYTTLNWENVTENAISSIEKLCENLFLGAINGDMNCKNYFFSMRKDFSIINAGEQSETYGTYKAILELYK